jgi:hypothetical protein
MNLRELKAAARAAGIADEAYALLGTGDERYCLTHDGPEWAVFYAERGLRNDERHHATETAACADLLKRLLGDPSARIANRP